MSNNDRNKPIAPPAKYLAFSGLLSDKNKLKVAVIINSIKKPIRNTLPGLSRFMPDHIIPIIERAI